MNTDNIINNNDKYSDLPEYIYDENQNKVKIDIKAVIFDYDKTLSEHDVYNDDWAEEEYITLFFGNQNRLERLKKFL